MVLCGRRDACVRILSRAATVPKMADKFVARAWLERAASPQDRRLSLVRLTDSGRTTLAAMEDTFVRTLQTHVLDALTERQLTSLVPSAALGAPRC